MLQLIVLVLLLRAVPSNAADMASAPSGRVAAAAQVVGDAEGTVISVDVERGRVTLKHGAIQALGMPAMTMVFRAADSAMLANVKPGDAVRFKVVRAENHFTVTQLAPR